MNLFVVSIRFTLKKTDTKYVVRNYAVLADTQIDAYQIIMNKHLDEKHLIIDIHVEESLESWVALYPDVDIGLEGDYADNSAAIQKWRRNRRDPTWLYFTIAVASAYTLIGFIIYSSIT